MTGLTKDEVAERVRAGKVNYDENPNTRTYKQIVLENTLTFFNFLNMILFGMVIFVGSFKNAFFITIILINTGIGILQEIRAKRILDELSVLTTSKARVIRDGRQQGIDLQELVLDDVILLRAGDQIPADAVVVKGSLEVNEALLTGEADTQCKERGAQLFSGSFVTAGKAYCRIIHVGAENYSAKLTREAKVFKIHPSELKKALKRILQFSSVILVPLGIGVFYKQFFSIGNPFQDSVVSTVSAILGMIPEGLVLLTSVALTVGTLTLARKRTLVQEIYCIETLAHVDTLCLDKTGTITSGEMCVKGVIPLKGDTGVTIEDGMLKAPTLVPPDVANLSLEEMDEEVQRLEQTETPHHIAYAMGNLMRVLQEGNGTFQALQQYFPAQEGMKLHHTIPFSSEKKYSGAVFAEHGTYLIGAAQFLFPMGNGKLTQRCAEYGKKGYRVLVLAHSPAVHDGNQLPENLTAIALLLITDVIRRQVSATLQYFKKQGVELKVISGDDPVTVSAVAKQAGLSKAEKYVDASALKDRAQLAKAVKEYTVFGRVTPGQKQAMVKELKQQGCTVAMTGDGVNDVLALKEADCSIAMASGSDAAKNVANVVLLDSDFSVLPEIVNQGRKVVNNIRRAASMFLIKTIFSASLSLLMIFFGETYPFMPIQMSLISACAVAIPTFLLANFEPDYSPIDRSFLKHVLIYAVPTALTITVCIFSIMQVCIHIYHDNTMLCTACVLVTGWSYMAALRTIYAPMNLFRKIVIYGMNIIFFLAAIFFQGLLELGNLEFGMIILVFVLMTFSPVSIEFLTKIFLKAQAWIEAGKERKQRRRKKRERLV